VVSDMPLLSYVAAFAAPLLCGFIWVRYCSIVRFMGGFFVIFRFGSLPLSNSYVDLVNMLVPRYSELFKFVEICRCHGFGFCLQRAGSS
ncbi:hypothetical protein A2U01_0014157, partial [Trifolium medium]|nr:hypothetical protein [Trifolium medium]